MIQLAIVAVGALVLWLMRAQRKRNLWRENWSTVPLVAVAILAVVVDRISYSTFKVSDILYTLLALALYVAFVYAWNRNEPREPEHE